MIRLRDASVLAFTKLRTRRIRTLVTVIVSGLLFAVLVAALTIFQGGVDSVNTFNKNGLNSRYIVSGYADSPMITKAFKDPGVLEHAWQLHSQMVQDKKAAAKTLDISYDPSIEPSSTSHIGGQTNLDILNFASPVAQQALFDYATEHPGPSIDEFRQAAAPYHPIDIYSSSPALPSDGTLNIMPGGQEQFPSEADMVQPQTDDMFIRNQFAFMPKQLTTPFMLKRSTWNAQADVIPLMVPYSVATKLLDIPPLPKSASAEQQLERIQQLNVKAADVTITACYRNTASGQQIQTATSMTAEIAKNAGNKNYQKPSLIYGLPAADSCGPAVVTSDTRTKQEKKTDQNQAAFDAQFSRIATEPDQQKLTFQIVGLMPDLRDVPSNSAAGIVQDLLGSSLSGVVAIPADMYSRLPSAQRYDAILKPNPMDTIVSVNFYAEFAADKQARDFIDRKSCTTRSDGTCSTADRRFQLYAYGSNSIGLKDVERKFNTFFAYAGLAIVMIAVVIMTGTVGRMLADGRRETAVFRAIGANRWDIVAVYGLYTLVLSLLIAAAALVLGAVAARIGDAHLWQTATVHAKLAFGGADTPQTFHFFGYSARVWQVAGAAIGAGLLGMVFPLLRNIRRNPIKDMREE